MKLLYITNGITGSGGLERVLSVKASLLAELYGYEVHILALNEPEGQQPFFKFSDKIIRHNLKLGGNPLNYIRSYRNGIKTMVSEIQPDVISVCDDGLKGFFVPKILGKKIPVVYERHVSKLISLAEKQGLARKAAELQFTLMNRLAKSFDAFVVLTEGNRNEWKDLNNLVVIPNPLPFYPEVSAPLTSKKVIAVGKYSHQKGFDLLLEAWAKLPQHLKDWELHLYGKQDRLQALTEQAEQLDVVGQVKFHGPDPNIEARFMEASVFVLSSRYEGFGMVIIEAMACGLPVVSFDCPYGPSDIITDGEDGFLAGSGDVAALSLKMSHLMENDALRFRMGQTAKNNVQRYRAEQVAEQWDMLFRQMTASQNSKTTPKIRNFENSLYH